MKCPEVQEHLSLWLDGEAPRELQAELAVHLEGCPACRRELAVLQRLDKALEELTVPVPGGLGAKVRRRLPRRSSSWQQFLALAACLVLGIGLGGALTGSLYAPPANGNGAEVANLEVFQDFPQGSVGTAVSFQAEEDPNA
jgi:anti-sigma factor (TIGR02949 family)